MKKILSLLVLAIMLVTMLCACGKFECDLCGEEKSGKKYTKEVLDEEITYCQDCHDDLEELGDMFG